MAKRNPRTVSLGAARTWAFVEKVTGEPVPYHGDCLFPKVVELRGQDDELLNRLRQPVPDHFDTFQGEWLNLSPGARWVRSAPDWKPGKGITSHLSVRCRKCETCMKAKARAWAYRAKSEIAAHSRTWFVTLTVSPDQRFNVAMRAEQLSQHRRGESLAAEHSREHYMALCEVMGPELTRWLKRIRKASQGRFRYLLAMEPHRCRCTACETARADLVIRQKASLPDHFGFPHAHLLIHEKGSALTQRIIRGQWRLGSITEAKLVGDHDPKAAWYVCKYISKYPQMRVRASSRYGQAAIGLLSELARVHVKQQDPALIS